MKIIGVYCKKNPKSCCTGKARKQLVDFCNTDLARISLKLFPFVLDKNKKFKCLVCLPNQFKTIGKNDRKIQLKKNYIY